MGYRISLPPSLPDPAPAHYGLIADNNDDSCNLISGMVFDMPCLPRYTVELPCNNQVISKSRAHDIFLSMCRSPATLGAVHGRYGRGDRCAPFNLALCAAFAFDPCASIAATDRRSGRFLIPSPIGGWALGNSLR